MVMHQALPLLSIVVSALNDAAMVCFDGSTNPFRGETIWLRVFLIDYQGETLWVKGKHACSA